MNTKKLLGRPALALWMSLLLAGGCQKKPEPAPPAPVAAAPADSIVSAEKTTFDQVTAKLNRGGNLYAFLDTQQALAAFSNRLDSFSNLASTLPVPAERRAKLDRFSGFLNGFVTESGLGQVSGLGLSSIAREKGFYFSKMVVYHGAGQDTGMVWSLFGKAPHPLDGLDLLPQSTALAVFSDLDIPLAWTNIAQQLARLNQDEATQSFDRFPAQFHGKTGLKLDDVLHSLAGEYGLILTLDEHKQITLPVPGFPVQIPNPGLALVIKVNSDLIFDRVDEAVKGNPLVSKIEEPNLKMRTFNLPIPLALDLRPSLARSGDFLILASSDTLVRDLLAVKSGTAKGYRSTDEFQKLSQGIPKEGNNFALVTGGFGDTIYQIQQQIASNQPAGAQNTPPWRQLLNTGTNTYSYSVGVNGPEGWEGFANGNHSLQSVFAPASLAAVAVAAIAVPNFVKRRETSDYNRIQANLRLLSAAKEKWVQAEEKKNGDPATLEDLKPFLDAPGISAVAGEDYLVHPVGQPPTARLTKSLNGHEAGSEISAE
jgi:hypothetical protein